MSYYNHNSLFPGSTKPIPNGHVNQLNQMNEKQKMSVIFLDVSPARTPYVKPSSPNAIQPLQNNLINPQINRDIIFENIKPVFFILRLMGVLPITRLSSGKNTFQLISPSMLYSVFVYFSMVGYVLYFSLHEVQILRTSSTEGKFEEAVIEYLFTVYLFPMMVVPILWYETRNITGVLNEWVDFETAYRQLAGQVLSINLYKKALLISVIIPILSTTSVIVTHVTMVHFKPTQLIPYVFLEILTYMLGGYWYLFCEALSVCANTLAEDFHRALRNIGPAKKISDYRALWLRLSKIARSTGIANCYTFTFVNLYLFLIITLSIYGLLSQISEGFGIKDIGLALTACCSILLLFFICDEAHYASHNVRSNFQKKLLMVELSWMNTDAQTEVNMFLRATEMNPSQISLGGFLNVNRTLFKSVLSNLKKLLKVELFWMNTDAQTEVNMFLRAMKMNPSQINLGGFLDVVRRATCPEYSRFLPLQLMTTMVTYLVVLLQFQISIPDDSQSQESEDPIANTTMAFTDPITTTTTAITTILTTIAKKKRKH